MASVPPFVKDAAALFFVVGKGGVGKTTCAAATALWLARRQKEQADTQPVLLLSTDPAHSLHDRLRGVDLPATLHTEAFNANQAVDAFRDAHRDTLHEIVARGTFFDDADIQELLDLALPGIDEAMAVLRLDALLTEDAYAHIVVDTAPTGHALRLFEMPERFATWVDFLDALLEKHRYMRARFSGHARPDALDDFVDTLRARIERVLDAVRTTAQALVVTQAEPAIVAETDRLVQRLSALSVDCAGIVVNRWPPDTAASEAVPARCGDIACWTLPEWTQEALVARLPTLWTHAARWDSARSLQAKEPPPHPPAPPPTDTATGTATGTAGPEVANPAPLPSARMVLVAGKGGVGKTTVACATALRLAEACTAASDARRALLLSTDPAHSVADVLGETVDAVSNTPKEVAPRLDAVAVDAEAHLNALRDAYAEEVQQFFQQTGGTRFDMPHDRHVTERLLDLAPPGIDEMMGITAVLDQLNDDRYAHLVLDMAPTGHFFRFVEMPDVFNAWIRSLFRLLRTYRHVVRVPRLNDRLVRLSKQIKALQQMLTGSHNTHTGHVYGVATPDPMVQAETERLVNHCTRAGLSIPVLFLNQMPADGLAASQETADLHVPHVVRIAHGTPPVGQDALRALGRRLYVSPASA